jgi:hypothetical protein
VAPVSAAGRPLPCALGTRSTRPGDTARSRAPWTAGPGRLSFVTRSGLRGASWGPAQSLSADGADPASGPSLSGPLARSGSPGSGRGGGRGAIWQAAISARGLRSGSRKDCRGARKYKLKSPASRPFAKWTEAISSWLDGLGPAADPTPLVARDSDS